MKTISFLKCLVLIMALPCARAAAVPDRQRVLLDANWRFKLAEEPNLVDSVPLRSWSCRPDPMNGGSPMDVALVTNTAGPDWKTTDGGDEALRVFQGKRFVLRSQVIGDAHKACVAAGVFGNTKGVELFQDGHSLGVKEMPRNGHLEWLVKYMPGTLVAKGINGDTVAATDTVETTGAPATLQFKTGRTTLAADGEDLIPVEVDVLDAHGRIVPTADNLVTFSVHGTGTVVGVGNGDPGDHDPDKADYRHAFNGKCMVLVGAAQRTGTIKLKATAAGLKPAMLELRSFAPAPSAAIRRS